MVKFARNDEVMGDQVSGSYVIDVDNNACLINSVMKIWAWASGGDMNCDELLSSDPGLLIGKLK
jgi:hypothetical protein